MSKDDLCSDEQCPATRLNYLPTRRKTKLSAKQKKANGAANDQPWPTPAAVAILQWKVLRDFRAKGLIVQATRTINGANIDARNLTRFELDPQCLEWAKKRCKNPSLE
ncbi:hypothetical protein TIFTF001_029020 [Ficus carica]|uniref:Uncharacterized protein n=1 Tax=Ficus carica TaxID=3494 RepID=A0AA88DRN7_FICCA|nr:hypothetical protein TIFTF001_029020 [Ficus carica]